MRFENGKVILENRKCYCDNGMSKKPILCQSYGQKQRGKKCQHCGTTSKHHSNVGWETVQCGRCNGSGMVPETLYDYMTEEMYHSFEFRVVRQNRFQSFAEQYLGVGLFSCVDYGRSMKENDESIIQEVKKSIGHQVCKVTDENGNVCDYIGIFVSNNGYSVIGMFNKQAQVA